MEDKYTSESIRVNMRELLEYAKSRSEAELEADVDEFMVHLRNVCRSISALWNEYKLPLLTAGVYVSVDICSVKTGRRDMFSRIGCEKDVIGEFLEERRAGEARNGRA